MFGPVWIESVRAFSGHAWRRLRTTMFSTLGARPWTRGEPKCRKRYACVCVRACTLPVCVCVRAQSLQECLCLHFFSAARPPTYSSGKEAVTIPETDTNPRFVFAHAGRVWRPRKSGKKAKDVEQKKARSYYAVIAQGAPLLSLSSPTLAPRPEGQICGIQDHRGI